MYQRKLKYWNEIVSDKSLNIGDRNKIKSEKPINIVSEKTLNISEVKYFGAPILPFRCARCNPV